MAVNPNPNPADQCCYAFRFEAPFPSNCGLILGKYKNVDVDGGEDPKCGGKSGQMFLQTAQ